MSERNFDSSRTPEQPVRWVQTKILLPPSDTNVDASYVYGGIFVDSQGFQHDAVQIGYKIKGDVGHVEREIHQVFEDTQGVNNFPQLLHYGRFSTGDWQSSQRQFIMTAAPGNEFFQTRKLDGRIESDKDRSAQFVRQFGTGLSHLWHKNRVHDDLPGWNGGKNLFWDEKQELLTFIDLTSMVSHDTFQHRREGLRVKDTDPTVWTSYARDIGRTVVWMLDEGDWLLGSSMQASQEIHQGVLGETDISIDAKRSVISSMLVIQHNFDLELAKFIGRGVFPKAQKDWNKWDLETMLNSMAKHSSQPTLSLVNEYEQSVSNFELGSKSQENTPFVDAFGNKLTFKDLNSLTRDSHHLGKTRVHHSGSKYHMAGGFILVPDNSQIMWNAVS